MKNDKTETYRDLMPAWSLWFSSFLNCAEGSAKVLWPVNRTIMRKWYGQSYGTATVLRNFEGLGHAINFKKNSTKLTSKEEKIVGFKLSQDKDSLDLLDKMYALIDEKKYKAINNKVGLIEDTLKMFYGVTPNSLDNDYYNKVKKLVNDYTDQKVGVSNRKLKKMKLN